MLRCLVLLIGILAIRPDLLVAADPVAPPVPAEYAVQIRYDIRAFRTERLQQYFSMTRYLKDVGFRRDPQEVVEPTEPEDPSVTRMRGFIASKDAPALLRQPSIRTIRLLPKESMMPMGKEPVRVDLRLDSNLPTARQQQLVAQTLKVLRESFEFQEAAGYDNQRNTRIVGALPGEKIDGLLNDLRLDPVGAKLADPFSLVWALRIVEVLPGMPVPAPVPASPGIPAEQQKITADLRELLADESMKERPRRVEVILANTPREDQTEWRFLLMQAAPTAMVEGRVGPLVTVRVQQGELLNLAKLPGVASIRLPRLAQGNLINSLTPVRWSKIVWTGDLVRKGRIPRVVIVESDFRGWESRKGKDLPKTTRLIDLTSERNIDLDPDPYPEGNKGLGRGVQLAQLVARDGPDCHLTLIRIDPAAPYMLQEIAQGISGELVRTLSLENRLRELETERIGMIQEKDLLLERRRKVLDNFGQDEDTIKARKKYFDDQADFDNRQAKYQDRVARFLQLQGDLRGLKDTQVVATGLIWTEGHPGEITSRLGRFFDDRLFRTSLWFHATDDAVGQSWTGLFRDQDGNGLMEFARPDQPLPRDSWSREQNFLAWQTAEATSADLPEKVAVRISFQWREAHEADIYLAGEDAYRQPLTPVRVIVYHQVDPAGKKQPSDDLEFVAQSTGLPMRLVKSSNSGTYEVAVQFVTSKPGRYVVRVEGRAPMSIRPADAPVLPGVKTVMELTPRLFVETLEGPGKAVWRDFRTPLVDADALRGNE